MTNLANEVSQIETEVDTLRKQNKAQQDHIAALEERAAALQVDNDQMRKVMNKTISQRDSYIRCIETILKQIAALRAPAIAEKPTENFETILTAIEQITAKPAPNAATMSEGTRKLLQEPFH